MNVMLIFGLRIQFCPKRSTSKYQTLDLGLIAHSKIRFRSTILRHVVDNTTPFSPEVKF